MENRFGRYEIRSEIGRGGMASVYLAYDPAFRREVAVKVLPPQYLENALLRTRFEREARAIATIEHPAIVPVYDFGEQDGQLFLVMRYMQGGSLSGRIRGRRLPLDFAAQLIAQLAPALDAVHARGIVHRDLKPGNILFDRFDNPALSDFGIAQLSEATLELTGEALVGTPAYMSPEQVRGDPQLDGRSDLYALGVILFEMLSGQVPYRAPTAMSTAMKHLTDPVPSLRPLRPDLPAEIDGVLARLLAKDPEARYAQAAGLAADLRSLPAGPASESDRTLVDEAENTLLDPDTVPETESRTVPETASKTAPEAASRTVPEAASRTVPEAASKTAPEAASRTVPEAASRTVPEGGSRQIEPGTPAGPPASGAVPQAPKPGAGRVRALLPWGIGGLALAGGLCLVLLLGAAALSSQFLSPRDPPAASATEMAGAGSPAASTAPLQADQAGGGTPEPEPEAEPGEILFSDDFSVPANGWPSGGDADGEYGYRDGAYRIRITAADSLYWAGPDPQFEDVRIEVEATQAQGADESYYGLLCRIQDARNFYYLVVRSDRFYTIGKYEEGRFASLLPAGWTFSEAIPQDPSPRRLQAECVGDQLRLFVDDRKLGEARDGDYPTGKVGLAAASSGDQGAEVLFDDLIVREVK